MCDSEFPWPQELSQSTFITSIWPVKIFVWTDGQLLINIDRQKFHMSEIISWRRHVASFVHDYVGVMR